MSSSRSKDSIGDGRCPRGAFKRYRADWCEIIGVANMKALITLLIITAAVASRADAQQPEGFVCITEQATGFAFNKEAKRWEPTNFRTHDLKYLLTKGKYGWTFKRLGQTGLDEMCREVGDSGLIRCDDLHAVTFNKKTLRFQAVYPHGYVMPPAGSPEGANTPGIEIGRCSPL